MQEEEKRIIRCSGCFISITWSLSSLHYTFTVHSTFIISRELNNGRLRREIPEITSPRWTMTRIAAGYSLFFQKKKKGKEKKREEPTKPRAHQAWYTWDFKVARLTWVHSCTEKPESGSAWIPSKILCLRIHIRRLLNSREKQNRKIMDKKGPLDRSTKHVANSNAGFKAGELSSAALRDPCARGQVALKASLRWDSLALRIAGIEIWSTMRALSRVSAV